MQRLSELHLQLGRELLSDLGDSHGRWLAGQDAGCTARRWSHGSTTSSNWSTSSA
jgi:hypothetical protein